MTVEQLVDEFLATRRCPATRATVERWLVGAVEDPERPNRTTILVELDEDAWAWNPHCVAEPYQGPGRVVYEHLPDGRVFAAFVVDDPMLDKLMEVARGT